MYYSEETPERQPRTFLEAEAWLHRRLWKHGLDVTVEIAEDILFNQPPTYPDATRAIYEFVERHHPEFLDRRSA